MYVLQFLPVPILTIQTPLPTASQEYIYCNWKSITCIWNFLKSKTFLFRQKRNRNPNVIYWPIPEKFQTVGMEDMNFQRYWIKSMCKIQGSIKRSGIFRGVKKKVHGEFPWVLAFDLEISKECHTVLQNFQGWKLVFSGISKGRLKLQI